MPSLNENVENITDDADEMPDTVEKKQEQESPRNVTEQNLGAAPSGNHEPIVIYGPAHHFNQSQGLPNGMSVRPRIPRSSVNRSSLNSNQEREGRGDQIDASVRDEDIFSNGYPPLPPLPHDETEQQGYSLFAGFVEQQYEDIGDVIPFRRAINTPNQREIGRMLRTIADSFQDTRGRQEVKCMAEAVDITNIGWEAFSNLCDVIFEGPRGVTPERIISLFFFFIDAAKTQAKKYVQFYAKQMIYWAITYILKKVCKSVEAAGGWMVVLRQSVDMMYKAAVSAVCVIAVVALSTYVVKSWSSSS